jgi:osmoprotectant transport system ATP-binding protein
VGLAKGGLRRDSRAVADHLLLELDGVGKRHDGVAVLEGVSLAVPAGQFVALVGPSGSGKTTLLKTINRLVEADEGMVRIGGRDVREAPAAELRRGIGYAFQGIGLFPHMDVAENIGIGMRLAGAPEAARRERVAELLKLVALPEGFASRRPAQLSGGQAQRVGLARALAGPLHRGAGNGCSEAGPLHRAARGPPPRPGEELPLHQPLAGSPPPEIRGRNEGGLMLLDEPFGALDPVTRDELGRAYRGLHDELGLTTIMVTHDMTEALLLADRIVVLIGGRVRADAKPGELMAGHVDAEVAELIAVPRRQAERLAALQGSVE